MITISEVLSQAQVADLVTQSENLVWRSGDETAGEAARRVKNNQQADLSSRAGARFRDVVETALRQNPILQAAAWPKRWSKLILSRTEPGGGYGTHIDNALMGAGERRLRTDLSYTLFLSGPDEYVGGELEIEQAGGRHVFKPAAGDVILYSSSTLHRVAPVTRGVRLVFVGWIESLVRDSAQREILFDLENLRAELASSLVSDDLRMLTLSKTIANLLRQWAVP